MKLKKVPNYVIDKIKEGRRCITNLDNPKRRMDDKPVIWNVVVAKWPGGDVEYTIWRNDFGIEAEELYAKLVIAADGFVMRMPVTQREIDAFEAAGD